MECMTNGCEAAMLRNLENQSATQRPELECVDGHSLGHHISPQGHLGGPVPKHLVRDGREVVDQTKIGLCICTPLRLRVDTEFRKRELSSLPPQLDGSLNL